MAVEILRTAPAASAFLSLSEHEAQTPESYHDNKPILRYHTSSAHVVFSKADIGQFPVASELANGKPAQSDDAAVNGSTPNGDAAATSSSSTSDELVLDGFDVWVTTENLIIYNTAKSTGLSIPYPSIPLHAVQRLRLPSSTGTSSETTEVQGLYMQVLAQSSDADEQDPEDVSTFLLTIVPPHLPISSTTSASTSAEAPSTETPVEAGTETETSSATAATSPITPLFTAVSTCADLHPDYDPDASDEEGDAVGTLGAGGIIGGSSGAGAGITIIGGPGDADVELSADQLQQPQLLDFPAELAGGGWITSENVHEYFDEEGNPRGETIGQRMAREAEGDTTASNAQPQDQPLGPGAGSVHARDEDGQGSAEGAAEETKWRRTNE